MVRSNRFDDLVRQCRLFDTVMRRLNERRNRGGRGGQQRGNGPSGPPRPSTSSSTHQTRSPTPGRRLPDTPHLTAEERDKYLKEGRCFKCGQPGHQSRVCPDKNKESTNVAEEDGMQAESEQVKE
jgi:hypothetical protein